MGKSQINNLIKRFNLYYHTLRYLTFRQIYHQIIHRLKKTFLKQKQFVVSTSLQVQSLRLLTSIDSTNSYLGNHTFCFLNKEKTFDKQIDWNFIGLEKLWIYNLNYFDFLNQSEISVEDSVELIEDFCKEPHLRKEGIEPYPISIRGINWIKFFVYNRINNQRYNSILYSHYCTLANNLEYHLLGNHLLENGFSLFFGAYYFKSESFYSKSKKILFDELNEQILIDGAHFELSPMYHQIVLFRLLDCINLLKNNLWNQNDDILPFFEGKATKMLGWIETVTFANGDVPMVNDSAFRIAPSTSELLQYGNTLGINSEKVILSESGYRMIRYDEIELFIDIGNIGPDYIPGHAHSDTFNFVLYVSGSPVIVDSGVSTYSRNTQRLSERSTCSHNTVRVLGYDQSEIWASFRVGRRAKVISKKEMPFNISASHDGYKFLGLSHQRTWDWNNDRINISDMISGSIDQKNSSEAFFHFHPTVSVTKIDELSVKAGLVNIYLQAGSIALLEEYDFAMGFNSTKKATLLKVIFDKNLESKIVIN